MSEGIAKKKKEAKLIREQSNLLTTRISLPKSQTATKLAKDAVKEKSNIGKSMLKVGTALVIIPDPITGAAGVPLMAAGKILESRQGASITETYRKLEETLKAIRHASEW